MELEQAQELQQNIAETALTALNRGESQETINKYEAAIRAIGTACPIPKGVTEQWLGLIAQRQYELRENQAGRPLPEYEPPASAPRWTGYDLFCIMQDLFGASVGMASPDDRAAMFTLAQELAASQIFQEWADQCSTTATHPRQVGAQMA